MNRTRWKLMIGALGLGLGGLAAVADVPSKGGMSCTPTTPKVARAAPEVPAVPPLPTPDIMPAAAAAPSLPLPPFPPPPAPSPLVKPPEVAAAPVMPFLPPPAPTPPPAAPSALPVLPIAAPTVEAKPSLPAIFVVADPVPLPPPVKPVDSVPSKPAFVEPPQPKPTPAAPTPPAAPAAEKKLKVLLHMGDDRPKFEIRDGDEVYLKVTSDKVDVKSPGDAGANMSTMRATSKVTFVTPGGEGTCNELVVVPGTGQVVVTGQVNFTYNWGKVETTVSGEKMTFRLGSTPGVGPAVAAK